MSTPWLAGMLFPFHHDENQQGVMLLCRLGSYGGEDSPLDISRVRSHFNTPYDRELKSEQGMYAGEVGVPRLLKMFDKYNIKTTWFIPGQS
jgi:peptidoglycan/xylan/chitin deacetylase (PgdA/CDA1 family)